MALINCPECNREISNTVNTCPHCGYLVNQIENNSDSKKRDITAVNLNTDEKSRSGKYVKIIISMIAVIVLVVVGITVNASNNNIAYKNNLQLLADITIDSATKAEAIVNMTAKVWYDTIYKKYDPSSAPFTIKESSYDILKYSYFDSDFVEDFNVAISRLYISVETWTDDIQDDKIRVTSIMKNLNNPPRDLENSYFLAEELFNSYTKLADLAINPSGTLQTFSQMKNEYINNFRECYRQLDIRLSN